MTRKTYKGLSHLQVSESRRLYGANLVTPPARTPLWRLYIDKFADPIIRILLVALAASFAIATVEYTSGETASWTVFLEPTGILIAVFLATFIGFVFEVKAAREFDVLNRSDDERPIQVIREGMIGTVACRDIVVGDIVLLHEGDKVPADARLLDSVSLQVSEAAFTGESLTDKSHDPAQADPEAVYPTDRVLRDTIVMGGHGVGKVEHVGDATEAGRLQAETQAETSGKTPLTLQLDRLGALITRASYIVAALIIVGRIVAYAVALGGQPFTLDIHFWGYLAQSVMIALTLIVVAVPEGLPMSVTLSLALSMRRMLKTGNLVRRMHACETMGACTVICTDKTGTLTENRMSVSEIRFCDVAEARELTAENMAVNATAHLARTDADTTRVLGNPTEGALLLWLDSYGCDYQAMRAAAPIEAQLAFSTERKFMATLVRSNTTARGKVLYVKGAPEIVMARCTLTADEAETWRGVLSDWQDRGMRTLAFACRKADDCGSTLSESDADGLTLIALCAISDPVRAEVPQAVSDSHAAGIALKIVTGDTPRTAREVARTIGLAIPADGSAETTGQAIAAMTDDALLAAAPHISIVARARPTDKRRLVEALRRSGEVVAVTGDGTNDAPALKAAQVGLAMGDGTSVAKEAGDITILDNSFASIARAVMWGRSLYRNIRRFLLFQLTINVAACLIVLIGTCTGTQSPLTVTQMLWVNLIMDTFAAMALASLPPEREVMRLKPRAAGEAIVSRAMWTRIVGTGTAFTLLMLLLLALFRTFDVTHDGLNLGQALLRIGEIPARIGQSTLSPYEESLFFTFFVMLQFWNLLNVRVFGTQRSALQGLLRCRGLLAVLAIILVGQVLLVEFGGTMVGVEALDLDDWAVLILSPALVLLIGEGFRAAQRGFANKRKG